MDKTSPQCIYFILSLPRTYDNYSEYCSSRSCKFLGFCSSIVEVSARVRYGTASLCTGLTLYGFMSSVDTEHRTLNLGRFFDQNMVCGDIISS